MTTRDSGSRRQQKSIVKAEPFRRAALFVGAPTPATCLTSAKSGASSTGAIYVGDYVDNTIRAGRKGRCEIELLKVESITPRPSGYGSSMVRGYSQIQKQAPSLAPI